MDKIDRDKVIDQIRKVQRKADGTNSEAEAELFLKKVADLLSKHGLTEADIKEKDLEMLFGHGIYDMKYADPWRRSLMAACGKFCGTFPVFLVNTTKMKIYGRELNIEASIETYIWVHDQIRQVARRMYPHDFKEYRQAQKGLSMGVCVRIVEIMHTYIPDGATDTKLPMIVEHQMVEDHVRAQGGIRSAKHRAIRGSEGLLNGLNSADQINLRPLVERRKSPSGLIAK